MQNNFDPVHQPKHYNTHPSKLEAWDINEDLNANLAAAFKYVFRHRDKDNPAQDIDKAITYLRREISALENATGPRWLAQESKVPIIRERMEAVRLWEPNGEVKQFYICLAHATHCDNPLQSLGFALSSLNRYRLELDE